MNIRQATRLTTGRDRAQAAKLLRETYNVDLLLHEKRSGADISLLAWPATGKVQAAAALVLHRDGTGFIHLPAGVRSETAVTSLYHGLKQRAIELNAHVALVLLPMHMTGFVPELLHHGFRHVGDVMTMESRNRAMTLERASLANPAEQPIGLCESEANDARLVTIIQSTDEGSLSDPSLGPDHSAQGFLDRLKFESPDHQDRFVMALDGQDAAVCLLSRYDAHAYIGVRYLGVSPPFRGRKLGGKLLAASLARVWSPAYKYCSVDVDRGNTFAVTVYAELGFVTKTQAAEFTLPLN